jgi:hypothetical protein
LGNNLMQPTAGVKPKTVLDKSEIYDFLFKSLRCLLLAVPALRETKAHPAGSPSQAFV